MTSFVLGLRGYVLERGALGLWRDAWMAALVIAPLWLCRNASTSSAHKIGLCIAAAQFIALFDRDLWQRLAAGEWLRRCAAYTLGLSVAWMLLRRSLEASWWVIDDHEIADALAVGHVDTLKGLWQTLVSHREIGSPPWSYPRYRPSYYTLRYIEAYLWGFDASRWYFMRLLLVGGAFALAWQSLFFVMGPSQASLTLLFALTGPFWGDVLCRLGPSEQYAMLGCAAFAYGATCLLRALYRNEPLQVRHLVLAALGSMLASGSKENFVFIPALFALLVAFAAYRRRLSSAFVVFGALALGYAGWVMLVVMVSVRRRGATIYGKDASLGSAPELALDAISGLLAENAAAIALAVCGAVACFVYRRTPGFARRMGALAVGIALCAGIYGLQAIVYKGRIPASTRYAFPASLIGTLMLSVAYALLRWQAQASGVSRRVGLVIDAAVLSVATYLVADTGFRDLKDAVAHNVARSQQFSQSVVRIANTLRAVPERPLLFTVGAPDNDLEPVVSLRIMLNYYGVSNPMFVSVEPDARGASAGVMRSWSEHGLRDWEADEGLHGQVTTHGKFLPLGALPASPRAFGIAFSSQLPAGVEPLHL